MKYGTLLVIDDNPAILTAMKICLGGTFGRIVTLKSPDNALATIAEENPAAILLDMNFSLGVNSGQEGMMWLSAIHRKYPDIPIVLMTAYAVRGLDINTSYTIYDLMCAQKAKGVAVIYVGEDLDVLLALCDKILVLCGGRVSGLVDARKVTKEDIGLLMTSVGGKEETKDEQ